jgi:hypothetical protein
MVGCEPTPLNSPEEMEMGITPPVLAAIEEAVALVESLVLKIRRGEYESIVSSESSDHAPLTPDGDCEHVYPNTPI